ncbi:hypothetical protein HYFRA_00002885 [Hymenoscyphus fraxineus]|uniref:Uncharacterized protein n=1 Tax=Hymenoscyphus fraxineus TaxID=746836 RepID=A0A9N9PP48_9HELO|nr:hypothetical protein HYFRA_00002885 [Hymenoscyphus fraxineus]
MPSMHHENGVGPTEGEGITGHMVMDSEQLLCPSLLENLVTLTGQVRMEEGGSKIQGSFTEYGAGAQTKLLRSKTPIQHRGATT